MANDVLSESYVPAPDTRSEVYPDRFIRPLPKRPLRARLSQEAADSILFPPSPSTSISPLYNQYGDGTDLLSIARNSLHENGDSCPTCRDHDHDHDDDRHYFEDDGLDSGDDENPVVVRRSNGTYGVAAGGHRQSFRSHASKASSSGPDGYDAFENTNNKKKRKIPTSGGLGAHAASLSADLASMGLQEGRETGVAALDDNSGVGQYYGSGNPALPIGSNISGAGRGRYARTSARSVSGRNPLGVSLNGTNAWMAGRPSTSRRELPSPSAQTLKDDGMKQNDKGIISAAIANAAALSTTPAKGQENISLLEQQTKRSTPSNTQFTFTSDAKGVVFPDQTAYLPPIPQHLSSAGSVNSGQRFATQGTQTSPNMAGQVQSQPGQANTQQPGGNQARPKKPRRRPGDVYAQAARQRKLNQQYTNMHHPPASEDMWVCEFCEYEMIFNMPPRALIRQYEIKDRKERRQLAEKRRLLEKAKMKGRKGKKPTKNAAKAASQSAQQAAQQQAYDQQQVDPGGLVNNDLQSEEYLGDEYDDEPMSAPAPPPNLDMRKAEAMQRQGAATAGTAREKGGGTRETAP